MTKQIKSKERVSEHGEVFTAEREVKAMCDLVAQECDRIDSRFLEPACGDGNFLAEILTRKLATVKRLYGKSAYGYEKNSILALTSLYGVDIMRDNVKECRNRLYKIWNKEYTAVCKKECNEETRKAAKYIIFNNILCGNALTLMRVDDECNDTDKPIIFPEWSFVTGNKLKRRDFRLDVLLKENKDDANYDGQLSLFGSDAMGYENWMIDPVTNEMIPRPTKEYPPINYRKVYENG